MPTRSASAEWRGDLMNGTGQISGASGAFDLPYDWRSRSAEGANTNPEELIGAAHAGCYSMALAAQLSEAGFPPVKVSTTARVHLEKVEGGFAIPRIDLETTVEAPGIDEDVFQKLAAGAKAGCPVSKALTGVEIHLSARLV